MPSISLPTPILLAEDDAADAMIVEEAPRSHSIDYELVRVRDGSAPLDFVSALERNSVLPAPHVFVLDHPENTAGLRCRELPIIAVRASNSPEEIQRYKVFQVIRRSTFENCLTSTAIRNLGPSCER
jgi:CheY-like chemotaxis protein